MRGPWILLGLIFAAGAGLLVGLLIVASPVTDPSGAASSRDRVEVVFLDVGAGDCAVIFTPGPDRKVVVIDGGRREEGLRYLSPLLASRGVTTVDLAILSHPDPDHVGGLDMLSLEYAIREFWDPGIQARHKLYGPFRDRLIAAIGDAYRSPLIESMPVGESVRVGPLEIRLLHAIAPEAAEDSNAASLVVRVAYGENSMLFTGDATPETEERLLAFEASQPGSLRSTVLKVPYHGSDDSSSPALLDAVRPDWAVVSTGGLPADSACLRRYANARIPVLRTDAGDPPGGQPGDDHIVLSLGREAGDLRWSGMKLTPRFKR